MIFFALMFSALSHASYVEYGYFTRPASMPVPLRGPSPNNSEGLCKGENVIGPNDRIFEIASVDGEGVATLFPLLNPKIERVLVPRQGFFLSGRDDEVADFARPHLLEKELLTHASSRLSRPEFLPVSKLSRAVAQKDGLMMLDAVQLPDETLAEARLVFDDGRVLLQPLSYWLWRTVHSDSNEAKSLEIPYRKIGKVPELLPVPEFRDFRATALSRRSVPRRILSRLCSSWLAP